MNNIVIWILLSAGLNLQKITLKKLEESVRWLSIELIIKAQKGRVYKRRRLAMYTITILNYGRFVV